ncbi:MULTISPECIES: hypothetical protein [Rhizobium/Agrobacterium group]|jgi:hypothetical protein|uniref:hypothetical protein n=1 Tax=Rhizobium/Agrobacterium group TaxID=227290 RepID=UPI0010F402B0|nr:MULTISPECIES: hypothetical protein [Rhizobium/Agrobacterium group]TCR76759.1 hypothetical protein EV561_11919 [Rhizobium sp. BK376]
MKRLLFIAAVGLLATNAMAMSSYDAKSVSCGTVHQKIAQEGAVVLRYPSHHPGMMMYNRYVTNSTMCVGQGGSSRTTIAVSDDLKCPVMTCNTTTGKGPNKNQR